MARERNRVTVNKNIQRVTMLPNTDPPFFTAWNDRIAFQGLENANLDALCMDLPGGAMEDFNLPDLFMPALRLKTIMTDALFEHRINNNHDNIIDYDAILDKDEVKQWLRVLLTVLCANDTELKSYDIPLTEANDQPLLLHVLYKSLKNAQQDNPSMTLFMYRKKDSLDREDFPDQFEPIAFTYSGIQTGLCPAENIHLDQLYNGGGWLAVKDPIAALHKPENASYRQAVCDFLQQQNNENGLFRNDLQAFTNALCAAIGMPHVLPNNLHRNRLVPEENAAAAIPNTWFTDQVVYFTCNANEGFEGLCPVENDNIVEKGKVRKILFPIRSGCLNAASPEDSLFRLSVIKANLQCHSINDSLIVSFTFGGQKYEHTYDTNHQASGLRDQNSSLAAVSVWPNQSCEQWNRYFVYLATEKTADNVHLTDCYTARIYAGNQWHAMGPNRQQIDANNVGAIREIDYVKELQSYPQAIFIQRSNEDMGLLIPPQDPLVITPSAAQHQLGVDFGTSNTIAYLSSMAGGQVTTDKVVISDNRSVLIGTPRDFTLTFGFAPDTSAGEKPPYKTVVRRFPNANRRAFTSVVAPLQYRSDLLEEYRKQLEDQLKWPDAAGFEENNNDTVAFLEHLMLLWLWQLLKDKGITALPCVFTYPKSMSTALRINFINNVIPAVINRMPNSAAFQMNYITEAEAVGPFINNDMIQAQLRANYGANINNAVGYLLIDIGGNTVDISAWQLMDDNGAPALGLCFEDSMKSFAGDYMQVEQVYSDRVRRGALLLELFNNSETAIKNQKAARDNLAPDKRADFDQVVRMYEAILGHTINEGNEDNQPVTATPAEFRRNWATSIDLIVRRILSGRATSLNRRQAFLKQIEMYFYFLFYFCGCMVGKALNAGTMKHNTITPLTLYLAGNGSLMYKLVDTDLVTFNRNNAQLFNTGIFAAVNDKSLLYQSCSIILSPLHKHEVAYGAANYMEQTLRAAQNGAIQIDTQAVDEFVHGHRGEDQDSVSNQEQNNNVDFIKLQDETRNYTSLFIEMLASNQIWKANGFMQVFGQDAQAIRNLLTGAINAETNVAIGRGNEPIQSLSQFMVKSFKVLMGYVDGLQ